MPYSKRRAGQAHKHQARIKGRHDPGSLFRLNRIIELVV
jgi:hypothetical protein